MKGTFFTADFVRDNSDNLRLLEINTDTAIQASLVNRLDWSGLKTILADNSITELHLIYKSVQLPIIDHLETAIEADTNLSGLTIEKHLEAESSIYPTSISDAEGKFILRFAYDEGAILDSDYAKQDLNLYKLFIDNSQSSKVPGVYYSGSSSTNVVDTLEDVTNTGILPDFLVRKTVAVKGDDISMYNVTGDGTDAEKTALAKTNLTEDGSIITNYYKKDDATKASSIRSYQIVYGSNLDLLYIGQYEIKAIFDYPTTLDTDGNSPVEKVENKHYSELTTEGINRTGGVLTGQSLVRQDGGFDAVEATVNGDVYASLFVSGSPNTDEYGTLFYWSVDGDSLPAGSHSTGSVMISSQNHNSANNSVISVDLVNGTNLKLGAISSILLHQASSNTVRYLYSSELSIGDSLFTNNGDKVEISGLSVEIHDTKANSKTYEFNLEDTDIFTVSGSSITVHNGPCFVAGTKVATEHGDKNIEDIENGELVWSFNHDTNEKELKSVISTRVQEGKETFTLETTTGIKIEATPDHPFHTWDSGYASFDPGLCAEINDLGFDAAQLIVGNQLTPFDSATEVYVSKLENSGKTATVYNLDKIEGNHNFFVNGVLVHNRYK